MQVKVVAARADQEPVLANLLELYAHDFSEINDLHLNPDGRFGYAPLPLYWQESSRYPFLIKIDGNLAGFVLVRKGSEVSGDENVWDVAEFFIVRGYCRHRIGMRDGRSSRSAQGGTKTRSANLRSRLKVFASASL